MINTDDFIGSLNMKRLSILILVITILILSSSPLWAFGGKSNRGTVPKKPGEIFGIMPWETRNSLLAKNAVIGIDFLEINDEKVVFNDLIDREFSTPPPEKVTYYFVNDGVYRMNLLYIGASRPFKDYSNYFSGTYGQPVMIQEEDFTEYMWTLDYFILRIKSNHQVEMRRQLEKQENDPEKIIVSIDIVFIDKKK